MKLIILLLIVFTFISMLQSRSTKFKKILQKKGLYKRLKKFNKDKADAEFETQQRAKFMRSDKIDFDIFLSEDNIQIENFPSPDDQKTIYHECSLALIGKNTLRFYAEYAPELEEDEHLCARVKFSDTLDKIGWHKLHVETFQSCPPLIQTWAAGYLEGVATYNQLRDFHYNLLGGHADDVQPLNNIRSFFRKNIKALKANMTNEYIKNIEDDRMVVYMGQTALQHAQSEGLLLGYNTLSQTKMDMPDLFIVNSDGEIHQLKEIFRYSDEPGLISGEKKQSLRMMKKKRKDWIGDLFKKHNTNNPNKIWREILKNSRCSTIVKVLKDNDDNYKDILISHSTWDGYSEMVRFFKHYEFEFLGQDIMMPAHKVTFSSYPGCTSSTDDWFMIDEQFVIMETTLELIDENSFLDVLPASDYIPDHYRVITANRLAFHSHDWIEWLAFINSGTYCSEWMVIDLHKFKESVGKPKLAKGTLIVSEQVPALVHTEDMSETLDTYSYWASYNVPFFDDVREKTGFNRMDEQFGFESVDYNWENTPRGVIFRGFQQGIENLNDMKHLMQYNPYKKDGYKPNPDSPTEPSFESPTDAIGARADLETPDDTFGEIDSKITNLSMGLKHECVAIGGPTTQDHEPFSWSKSGSSEPHRGQPDVWNFDWETMNPETILNRKYIKVTPSESTPHIVEANSESDDSNNDESSETDSDNNIESSDDEKDLKRFGSQSQTLKSVDLKLANRAFFNKQ